MGLDDALIFTRVVECHSFTQAALGLAMQKSTVSRRIALLEERLGVRLLNRTTRKLRLTEVGQAYYERCRQIMLDFAEAEQAVMQLQLRPSGLLRITAPIEFGQLFLGRVLGAFMREYPEISAEVELTSRRVDPVEEGVDIAMLVGQPQDSTLIARPLLVSARSVCASPAYLLGQSVACQRVLSCNNITFAREAALAGAGIAGLPLMISREEVASGRLIEVLPEAQLPGSELYAVYPSRRFQTMKVKAFLDFLLANLSAQVGPLLEP
jgi:DNA-binding transcriptional LysR family regulator